MKERGKLLVFVVIAHFYDLTPSVLLTSVAPECLSLPPYAYNTHIHAYTRRGFGMRKLRENNGFT